MKLRFSGRDQPRVEITQFEESYRLRFDWDRLPDLWLEIWLDYEPLDDFVLRCEERPDVTDRTTNVDNGT